jgi:aminoglycoside phosphotransferase (APT) family kinase protein
MSDPAERPDRRPIDASLVSDLLAAQFPQWAALPVTLVEPGGWDNRTFRIGERLRARLPSRGRYAAQVEREARWLPALAASLPLPISAPLALGAPGEGYPFPWTLGDWIDGDTALVADIADQVAFARDLAAFLSALRRSDATGGPRPGAHNFHRGGDLAVYAPQVEAALAALGQAVDARAARAVWDAGLAASFCGPPVWLHGDVAPGNLLVRDGRLAAVIDFGQTAVGDPACDLVIAWTVFDGAARDAFREAVDLDAATWARARAWALWKALIVWAGLPDVNPQGAGAQPVIVKALLSEHESSPRRTWDRC